ncbi:MAG: zinc-ribbon domain-containing protein [Candidatus Omnitrophica bacterium]|nr:zinc-ribbon domain-containing protein [Candidatus Omnitrophota bacterium]
MLCPKCGEKNEEGSTFCQNCGTSIKEEKTSLKFSTEKGLIGKIERSLYFRIARGFAWFILIPAVIALIFSIVSTAPTAMHLIGGSTSVSKDEVKKALESKSRRYVTEGHEWGEDAEEKIDPELMAKLDKEVYELISLFPMEIQRQWGVEGLRNQIKNHLAFGKGLKDKIDAVKDAKDIIKDFPESERVDAVDKFFTIKNTKDNLVKKKQAEAKVSLGGMSAVIMSSIAVITLVTMILVLLAIERNTRKT